MRSTRQPKRKINEVSKREKECRGGSMKKSAANGTGRGDKKSECKPIIPDKNAGVLQCSAASLSGQRFLGSNISDTGSGRTPPTEFQIHQKNLSAKIILQLFPLDENTRRGLEKDGYNPFLELSLSVGKKISSVIKHLNSKWRTSSIAHRQLMLFPFNTRSDKITSCRRWTSNDRGVTAGEVYVAVESPVIFRLRYGWFSDIRGEMFGVAPESSPIKVQIESECNRRSCSEVSETRNDQEDKARMTDDIKEPINTVEVVDLDANALKSLDVPVDHMNDEVVTHTGPIPSAVCWDDNLTNLSIGGLLSEVSLQEKINDSYIKSVNKSDVKPTGFISDVSMGGLLSEASLQGKVSNPDLKLVSESSLRPIISTANDINIGGLQSEVSLLSSKSRSGVQTTVEKGSLHVQSPWVDNLTNLSIGGLLSEASLQEKINNCNHGLEGRNSTFKPIESLSDSFDAFVAAQLSTHSQALKPPSHESHSSILDAEETCHAFPVGKLQSSIKDAQTSNEGVGYHGCSNDTCSKTFRFSNVAEMNNHSMLGQDSLFQQLKIDPVSQSRGVCDEESSLGLSSVKWNESLGPFDLGLPKRQVTTADSISISEIVR